MVMLKTNTQTITLDGSEQEVRFNRNYPYFWVQNQGDSDVLISINNGIAEGKDGVIVVPSGGTACTMHGYDNRNRFYLLGSGKVQVMGTSSAHNPFKAAQGGGDKYTLPVATTDILGGVKVDGTTITANADGVISALNAANEYVLPAASEETLGGIKSGGDISVSTDGTVTVNSVGGKTLGKSVPEDAVFTDTVYTLPAASAETLGGVKPDGTTITADENGVISAVASGGSPKITKLLSITKTQTESIAYTPNSPYTNYKYLIIKIDNNNKNTTTGMMIFERTAFTVGQSKMFPFVYDETAKQCYYYITFLANGNITIGANVTSCTIWGSNDIFTEI